MYCKQCGSVLDADGHCPNCGAVQELAAPAQATVTMPAAAGAVSGMTPQKRSGFQMWAYIAAGVVTLILFFVAAHLVAAGGSEIMQIQSVGGKTLEEAYYFELGNVYAGYAMALRGAGIFGGASLILKGVA